MPTNDIEVHDLVKRDVPRAGCYNLTRERTGYWVKNGIVRDGSGFGQQKMTFIPDTMSRNCRHMGHKVNGVWEPLPECVGCQAEKDHEYIEWSRRMIDEEFK